MKLLFSALILFILFSSFGINTGNYSLASPSASLKPSANATTGGYIDELRFIRYPNPNIAYQETGNGNLDTYLFQIPLQLVEEAKKNPNLKIYEKEGLSYGFLLNPSNNNQTFNPFSFKEIRFALNFLIDRNFMVNDVLKGFGYSIVEPYGQFSPEYQNIVDVVEPLKIKYNPEYASTMISDSMEKAGASLNTNGKWVYQDKPVTVKILIRNDDTIRKTFGDVVSSELEKIGFTVIKEYGDLLKANQIIYGSNPIDLNWNMYTESFVNSAFLRYNHTIVGQMYAPWMGSMPGSQNPAFWQYSNSTIDSLTQKLVFNNYTSEEERNNLLKKAESIGIQESVRLFFARSNDPYITSNKISGLINDYSSGIANKMSFMNAQKEGSNNDTLNIGMNQIYQGAWNIVNGCTDFFCRQIYSMVSDNPVLSNPYTGDPMPFRNNWSNLVSSGPLNETKVPNDVIVWNPFNQTWDSNDDNNKTSLMKITMEPLFSKWHNGIPMDRYDLLYSYYFPFEWSVDTKNNDRTFDAEFSSLTLPTLPLIKGVKFNENNDTFDSYIDMWHYDKNQLPQYGNIWASEPWEITAATERLVSNGKLSYSRSDANIRQNEQLSMVLPSHSELIRQELEKMKLEKFIPNSLKGLVTVDYAIKRYDSSIQWINLHQNAVIGNGPYYLDTFNPSGGIVILKKFNDATYPYEAGYFSSFEDPQNIKINKISIPKFIKIGSPFNFDITVNLENDTKQFNGMINYFISDRNDNVIIKNSFDSKNRTNDPIVKEDNTDLQNTVNKSTEKITLSIEPDKTKQLSPGPAKLKLFITSENSLRPIISENVLIARR